MAKLTISNLTTLGPGSAVTTINSNNDAIEAAMEKTLSRDGTSPNSMEANLDMNSYRIQNLVAAVSDTEPVRLAEMTTELAALETTVQTIATTTQGYLNSVTSLYDQFDDRYLGNKASDPTLDNDGNTLITGTLYFNTTTGNMKVYDGATWDNLAPVSGGGDLVSTNNLSDVANAATARTNLGLAIGTNVQAYDADLTTWAGLTPSANAQSFVTAADYAAMRVLLGLVIGTNVQAYDADLTTWAGLTPSANAQSLVTAANYAAMKALLDLEIGVDVQAYDAQLADIAGITFSQGDIIYHNGANVVRLGAGVSGQFLKTQGAAANPIWDTIAGGGDLLAANNLSDLANAATARTNLGLAIGTNVQAYDADLTTWAGLTPSANAQSLVTAANYAAMRALLDLEAGTDFNAYDATLAALAAYNTNGVIVQTAADTFAGRTITGTAAQITVTNGDGVAGNPTLSLPADVLIPTVLTVPNTGLHILDTNATHDLIIAPGSNLTADHTLTITTGDADRTLDISAASVTISTAGAALIDDASASDQRTTLGLAIGTNVQAWDADLDTIAGLTATTDSFIQAKSSAWAARTIAQVKTDLGLTGTNSGDQTNLSGITFTYAELNTAVTDANVEKLGTRQGINTQTASYVLVLGDAGYLVNMNVAGANTLTVPPNSSVAFPTGTWVDIAQYGAGQTTITAGVGVTLRSRDGKLATFGQYAGATIIKINTNEWMVFGDLA